MFKALFSSNRKIAKIMKVYRDKQLKKADEQILHRMGAPLMNQAFHRFIFIKQFGSNEGAIKCSDEEIEDLGFTLSKKKSKTFIDWVCS